MVIFNYFVVCMRNEGTATWTARIASYKRPQCAMTFRVARRYCTTLAGAACMLVSMLPWDLDARALSVAFHF